MPRHSAATTRNLRVILLVVFSWFSLPFARAAEIAPIPRKLPPPGIELTEAQSQTLRQRHETLRTQAARTDQRQPQIGDALTILKAIDYALTNGEFFDVKELKLADDLLSEAQRLLSGAQDSSATSAVRTSIHGFRSKIDGSWQPYGVVLNDQLPKDGTAKVYVWLHGRGDKATDLQFLAQRRGKPGEFVPVDGIVVHPFGRHCNAFKFAGETDVFESIDAAYLRYGNMLKLDRQNIVLCGFSMGGAGAWHLGAHYPGRWTAISPGAGFAETARYQNLTPEKFPPWYEQTLWGLYDVPNYVRNLFNMPVIAYSGELDKQIQAARVMEEAYQREGKTLPHLIGPGMGHKYHPDTLSTLKQQLSQQSQRLTARPVQKISLQTNTLRYPAYHNNLVALTGLVEHWVPASLTVDARNDAHLLTRDARAIDLSCVKQIATQKVTHFELVAQSRFNGVLQIDGQSVPLNLSTTPGGAFTTVRFAQNKGQWRSMGANEAVRELRKLPGLQGPIDDVFYEPFLLVLPSGKSSHPQVERWVDFETKHMLDRWRRLFRGDAQVKQDTEVTDDDLRTKHIVVWGEPETNALLKRLQDKLPVRWSDKQVTVDGQTYDRAGHIPVLIYPNPLANNTRYVVLNSGPTFREGHDSSNSLQTPKLPDWAVIDLSKDPDANAPGRIADAGFFDEQWKFKPRRKP